MSGWVDVTPAFKRPPKQRFERWEFVGELRGDTMPARIYLYLMDGAWRVAADGLQRIDVCCFDSGQQFVVVADTALQLITKRLDEVHREVTEAIRQARKVAP